jgi:hypothetical protein
MVLTTWAVYDRTFNATDRNLRPIILSQHGVMDWVDQRVGPGSSVTAIMYPISTDWFVNQERWFDFVYFNKSIQRLGRIAGLDPFDYNGFWFPKLDLHFDGRTGAVAESPTRWILESVDETRFRIGGLAIAASENGVLVDAGPHWRLAWRTLGTYDDGWTRPGVPVHVRVYPRRGQRHPELRTLSFVVRSPDDVPQRPITFSSEDRKTRVVATPNALTQDVTVCVPVRGYADVKLDVEGSSSIPGDLATLAQSTMPRQGGIAIASLGEADEIGGSC